MSRLEQTDLMGKILIAMPGIGDSQFAQSVILVCAHAEDFAMGIVLNKPISGISLGELLDQLDIQTDIALPNIDVLDGGPVGRDRGFVVHSEDFNCAEATMHIGQDLCLTATRDALRAIASQQSIENAVLALGYSGWGPGQVEAELSENAWLVCEPGLELVYGQNHGDKWRLALAQLGVTPETLQIHGGHA